MSSSRPPWLGCCQGVPRAGPCPPRSALRAAPEPPGLRLLRLNLPPGRSGGDGQPAEPMAAQARRWAEATEPLAARASGRGGGARRWPPDPEGALGTRSNPAAQTQRDWHRARRLNPGWDSEVGGGVAVRPWDARERRPSEVKSWRTGLCLQKVESGKLSRRRLREETEAHGLSRVS